MTQNKDRRPRVREARKFLAQNGGPIQQKLNEQNPGTYLIEDLDEDGKQLVYVTKNDELILRYYDGILSGILLEQFLATGGRLGQE